MPLVFKDDFTFYNHDFTFYNHDLNIPFQMQLSPQGSKVVRKGSQNPDKSAFWFHLSDLHDTCSHKMEILLLS